MKILFIYRPGSEHSSQVEEYIRRLNERHIDAMIETINIDTREGSALASMYDVLEYPAILVMRQDGTLHNMWVGDQLPLIDELLGYLRA